jgi:UDP-N-acetylmuramoylalanine--D-glutamate ligase
LLEYQRPEDAAALNADDPILRNWTDAGQGRKFFIGRSPRPEGEQGVSFDEQCARLRHGNEAETISFAGLRVRGGHNRFNAACAALGAWLMGADHAAIERGMAEFPGLPDRLEFVAEKNGARYYNDSIATTPESTVVALDAFTEPVVLIAGGSPKNLSFAGVGARIAARARDVILLGRTAPEIEAAIRTAGGGPNLVRARDMAEAVAAAYRLALPGDVVLMSPASASFDMFRNYAERGRVFKELVRAL